MRCHAIFDPPDAADPRQGRRPSPLAFKDSTLPHLLTFVRPYRWIFALGLLATLVSSGLGLVFPGLFGRLIDSSFLHVGSHDTAPLDRTVLGLLAVFACTALFAAAQSYLLTKVGSSVVADLRRALFVHLMGLWPRFFGEHKTGDLTSRVTSDVGTVQLSLLTLVMIPLIVGTAATLGRKIRQVSRSVQDQVARSNSYVTEAISGIQVVQSFTAQGLEEGRYNQGVQAGHQAALGRARLQATMSNIMSFLSFSALALVLWYGGRQVIPVTFNSCSFHELNRPAGVGTKRVTDVKCTNRCCSDLYTKQT